VLKAGQAVEIQGTVRADGSVLASQIQANDWGTANSDEKTTVNRTLIRQVETTGRRQPWQMSRSMAAVIQMREGRVNESGSFAQ
jgi:hypothetical protein